MKTPRKSLQTGRPPTFRSSHSSMSRKTSRNLINKHHQLERKQRQAIAQGDKGAQSSIADEISKLGGLERYQQASLQGQSNDRGGDTSRILLQWLPLNPARDLGHRCRLLEIGSLSTRNACARSGRFEIVQIDLNSREPGILKQDFMLRPLPRQESERFDIISLSLVLNFVPEAEDRGQMLLRTIPFLRSCSALGHASQFPALYLVLPRSCIENSRYLTNERLLALMECLGFRLIQSKISQKLYYSLWARNSVASTSNICFSKVEVNPGRTRNNFCITLSAP